MARQQIGLVSALAIGFASMLGAGVFVVFRDAAAFAQNWLFAAIVLAGLVASLNAASVYRLASQIDRPGGVYAYARVYLNATAAFTAGFAFVFGKIGSIAAIALVFADYLAPETRSLAATAAIIVLTTINVLGINRTANVAIVLATITVTFLVTSAALGAGYLINRPANALSQTADTIATTPLNVLTAASLLFFAFAGYARVATLGDEVREPRRNIPRAIRLSLAAVLALYLVLSIVLTQVLGAALSTANAPLLQLNAITAPWMPGFVTLGVAALACLGSILALLAGVSRTAATMAEDQELPKIFALRNRFGAPWFSETLIAAGAIVLVQVGEIVWVIGFSSFSVLLYYAIGHLSALKMSKEQTFWWRLVGIKGFLLCVLLALVVPGPAVIVSLAIILGALVVRRLAQRRRVV